VGGDDQDADCGHRGQPVTGRTETKNPFAAGAKSGRDARAT
jgi:hypothetical protein